MLFFLCLYQAVGAKYKSKVIFNKFELKLMVFVMTKAVSNRVICFIVSVIIVRIWALSLNFASHGTPLQTK